METADLARENALLKARLAEVEATLAETQEANRRLQDILHAAQREKFGKRSEKLSPDQFNLPLEDAELAQACLRPHRKRQRRHCKGPGGDARKPARNRGHLPRICPGRAGDRARQHALSLRLRRDGKDRRGRFRAAGRDPRAVPGAGHAAAQIRLPPLLASRGAGARPEHVVPGGLPTELFIAWIIVSKFGTTFRSTARRRSSSGRDRPRSRHARQLGRARLFPPDADHQSHESPSARSGPHLCR
ncbi:insertion sequence transposase protein (plasmid) [Frigidibacter mobilis]|uniref:Insertion sequence transposase protein n=1 Tax=Frigidibacter mobilis TaxID=1335048 RepID=A0A159Z9R1_9RHOB|nr:insertion sequence transposase protein [Frigidibacter mobilis]